MILIQQLAPQIRPRQRIVGLLALLFATVGAVLFQPSHTFTRPWLWRGVLFAITGAVLSLPIGLLIGHKHRRTTRFIATMIVGATTGITFNAILTVYAANRFDRGLLAAIASLRQGLGKIEFESGANAPPAVRVVGPDNIERSVGVVLAPTPLEIRILCAGEDERCFTRKSNVDAQALLRVAVKALERMFQRKTGRLPGGSNISEQDAGLLLHIKPTGNTALNQKVTKSLAGMRLDDLVTREEQVGIYLSLASFGTWHGQEIIGIAAASRIFYGKDHTELGVPELAELVARLRDPSFYFPYIRPDETPDHYQLRKTRLHDRAIAIIEVAERNGWISQKEAQNAGNTLFDSLTSPEAASEALDLPHMDILIGIVQRQVPDAAARRLQVRIGFDRQIEAALTRAARVGFERFLPSLPAEHHIGDFVEVDASVADDETGVIIGELGMAANDTDCASHCKPELYGYALETGVLSNMGQVVPGTRIMASYALTKSINGPALSLVSVLGPSRYARYLETQGYSVVGPYSPIALGAGVSVSPRKVATNFLKFAYVLPGWRTEAPLIARVVDANSGLVLYQASRIQVFQSATAIEVRKALEDVPRWGTASHAMRGLIASGTGLAVKTGTSGFYRQGMGWQGTGGSWTVAADQCSGLTVAVRVRWRSNRPFELEGGQSAALIVADFIRQVRNMRGDRSMSATNSAEPRERRTI